MPITRGRRSLTDDDGDCKQPALPRHGHNALKKTSENSQGIHNQAVQGSSANVTGGKSPRDQSHLYPSISRGMSSASSRQPSVGSFSLEPPQHQNRYDGSSKVEGLDPRKGMADDDLKHLEQFPMSTVARLHPREDQEIEDDEKHPRQVFGNASHASAPGAVAISPSGPVKAETAATLQEDDPERFCEDRKLTLSQHESSHSAEMPIAAEIAPDELDREAQISSLMQEETKQEIVAQVQRQLIENAVIANEVHVENKRPCLGNKTKLSLLMAGLILIVVIIVVVVIIATGSGGGETSPTRAPTTIAPTPMQLCTLCAGGDGTEAINSGSSFEMSCSELNSSQHDLVASSEACLAGQAFGWRYCGCPIVPIAPQNSKCTMCLDRASMVHKENYTSRPACSDLDIFMAHMDIQDCDYFRRETYASANHCSCPTESPELQSFREILSLVSDDSKFDEDNAQRRALYWMSLQDPAHLSQLPSSSSAIIQRYIVVLIYFSMGGLSWKNSYTFLSKESVCSWNNGNQDGIYCANGQIYSIQLSNNHLKGDLPDELTALAKLQHLDMSYNSISGTIPEEIGLLDNLVTFDIHSNFLLGPLPESLFNIRTLRLVWLDNNDITGILPSTNGNARNLELFSCNSCLLKGSIPESLSRLSSLKFLDLGNNLLEGHLPTFAENIDMENLHLYSNNLTGPVSDIVKLTNLKHLLMGDNQFSGTIPHLIGNLMVLEDFVLSRNFITGSLPESLFNIPTLSRLSLDENYFNGSLPPTIGNAIQLEWISCTN